MKKKPSYECLVKTVKELESKLKDAYTNARINSERASQLEKNLVQTERILAEIDGTVKAVKLDSKYARRNCAILFNALEHYQREDRE